MDVSLDRIIKNDDSHKDDTNGSENLGRRKTHPNEPGIMNPREPTEQRHPILIVDDDYYYRELLSIILIENEYSIETAEGGAEALQMIAQKPYDQVLLDNAMSGMDGLNVLREIRMLYSINDLPIIMVTANHNSDYMIKAFQEGANDYIAKPVQPEVMLARVATQLNLKRAYERNREFLGIASHDLKKPLQVIGDVIETIQEDFPSDASQIDLRDLQERLAIVNMSIDYMQRLVNDYLDISTLKDRHIQFSLQEVDLNALVGDALAANIDYAKSKSQTLLIDLEPDLPTIHGDQHRLMQVLDNLIGNAIKFSSPDAVTQVQTFSKKDQVVIEIRDAGPGFKPQELDKVFTAQRSWFSNRPTGGEKSTGLGLRICQEIIKLHRGEIGVLNNDPGPGATFWFRLPLRAVA